MNQNELLLTLYCLRHQESVQNKDGFGDADTELTEGGKESASGLSRILSNLGIENIDYIIAGNLKRHKGTIKEILRNSGYQGEVLFDEKLNSFFSGSLLEQPASETEKQYNLDKIRLEGVDLAAAGIYPFNPLYCRAYSDRNLRQAVFPDETTLTSFDEIENRVKSFQTSLIEKVSDKPSNIVLVSSCSPNGFNLEYSAFGTIGENILNVFGSEQRPIFPQGHDEIMTLGYSKEDLAEGRPRLHAIEGNVKIK